MIGPAELLILLVLGLPWIIIFIDILRNEFTGNNKLVWILVVTFVPIIGPLTYIFIGRKQKVTAK